MSGCVCVCVCVCVYVCVGFVMCGCFGNMCTCTGCPNKSARFNFVIKHTIYSKSADIFISVQSTHTLRLCNTISDKCPSRLSWHTLALLTKLSTFLHNCGCFANDTSTLRLELRNCLWFAGIDTKFHKPPKKEVARCQITQPQWPILIAIA